MYIATLLTIVVLALVGCSDSDPTNTNNTNNLNNLNNTNSSVNDMGPDVPPDMGPDLSPDMGPDLSPDMAVDMGADVPATPWVPDFYDDFESPADGTAMGSLEAYGTAGRSTISAERAQSGNQSARMEIREGDNGGFGKWGFSKNFSPQPAKGDEIWLKLDAYWPADFTFSASPWMKFIRFHNRTSGGDNGGYNDLYIDEADSNVSVLRTIKESHNIWAVYDGDPIPRDQWERYEMYLSIDDKSVDDGGEGRVRIWRDGTLIFDRTDVPTITEAGGTIDFLYMFTYWNNEMPPNNVAYIDNLIITSQDAPPPNRDDAGNAFINDWGP